MAGAASGAGLAEGVSAVGRAVGTPPSPCHNSRGCGGFALRGGCRAPHCAATASVLKTGREKVWK